MLIPDRVNNISGPGPVDVIYGLGTEIAKMGDKVYVKYQRFTEKDKFEDEVGPFLHTLGGEEYCGEFDEGICGMKIEGTRHLRITPDKAPRIRKSKWKCKFLKRHQDCKIYQVTLLAILSPTSNAGTK